MLYWMCSLIGQSCPLLPYCCMVVVEVMCQQYVVSAVPSTSTVECQLSKLQSFEHVGQPNGFLKSILFFALGYSMFSCLERCT